MPAIAWGYGTTGKTAGDTTPVSWTLGSLALNTVRTTESGALNIYIWNTGNTAERINISVTNSATWQAAAQSGLNRFAFGVKPFGASQYSNVSGVYTVFSNLGMGVNQRVDLRFQAPTQTSTRQTQSIAIQFTATAE